MKTVVISNNTTVLSQTQRRFSQYDPPPLDATNYHITNPIPVVGRQICT